MPGPLTPDSTRTECRRSGPPPLAPRGAWSGYYQLGALGPFAHPALGGGDIHHGEKLIEIPLWEGDCPCLCVQDPPP